MCQLGRVQIRGGRPVLFTLTRERAEMISVETGRDIDGWREILQGLSAGTPVITMGQTLVDSDAPVSVVEEDGR